MFFSKFNPKQDKEVLRYWLRTRELPTSVLRDLPENGYAVFEEDHMIAAGFIRKCEGNFGLIDSFITNPKASPKIRDKALDLLTTQLIVLAKELKITQLLAYTRDKNTLMRATKHGFVQLEHAVAALNLIEAQ